MKRVALSWMVIMWVGAAKAGVLPALINFDGDIPGQQPELGGPGQPTELVDAENVIVQSDAYGINTQPVTLTSADDYVSVDYRFDPVTAGIVRVEATVSFGEAVTATGYFLQTSDYNSLVVSRLWMGASDVWASSQVIGNYTPNQPFRVRMDIDLSKYTWSAQMDEAMNGFQDDPIVGDLPFVNLGLTKVSAVHASLNAGLGTTASAAYDDISICVIPEPTTLLLFGFGGLATLRKRRR